MEKEKFKQSLKVKEFTSGYLWGDVPEDRDQAVSMPDACMYTSVWSISDLSGLNPDKNIGWGKNSSFSHEWNRSHCKAECRTMIPSSHHGRKECKSHFSWCVLRMGPSYVYLHPCWVTKLWIGKNSLGFKIPIMAMSLRTHDQV